MVALIFIILYNIVMNLDHSMAYGQYNFKLIKKHQNIHPTSTRRRDISLLTGGYINPQVSNDYFYAILNIGEPTSQRIEVALDTGSPLPYFACKSTCDHCGIHDDAPFNINTSTSFNWLSCNNTLCQHKTDCTNNINKCEWQLRYVDGSSISALVGTDLIAFYNNMYKNIIKIPLVFGCSITEANSVYSQGADGIMGLSQSPTSFLNQIFKNIDNTKHILGQKQFAHCFGKYTGILIFGSLQINHILNTFNIQLKYTPFITKYNNHGWYKVKTIGFKVEMNSNTIHSDTTESIDIQYMSNIQSGYHGTVLDTGSSTLSVPANVASKIRDGVLSLVHSNVMLNGNRFEWQTDNTGSYDYVLKWNGQIKFDQDKWNDFIENYMQLFPDIVMLWDADSVSEEPVEFRVQPAQYLLFKSSYICLDLFGDVQSVLVGSNVMINKLIVYDVQNMRLGVFDNIDCGLLAVYNHTDVEDIGNVTDIRENITFESTIAIVNDSFVNENDKVEIGSNAIYELSPKSAQKSFLKSYFMIYFTLIISVLLIYCTYLISKARRDGMRYQHMMEFAKRDNSNKEVKINVHSKKGKNMKREKINEKKYFLDVINENDAL
eukprot:45315_1